MAEMSVPVVVLPRKTQGLQGDPAVFGNPQFFALTPLEEALSTAYPFDAHLTMYRVVGQGTCPRINKTGYQYLADEGYAVVAEHVFVDVDNPNHAPWSGPEEIAETLRKVRATPLGKNAGFYATRHGYRLFWRLREPLDVRYYESLSVQLIERLLQDGIIADDACTDWTRLFRLPHATPEGDRQPIDLPFDFAHGILAFEPAALTESRMPKVLAGVGEGWSHLPPPVLPADPAGVELLKSDPELYKRAKKGQPLADTGSRYKTILRAVGIVTKRMDNPTPDAVYNVLAFSVASDTRHTSNGGPPTLQTLWDVCKATCLKEISERAAAAKVVEGLTAKAQQRDKEMREKRGMPSVDYAHQPPPPPRPHYAEQIGEQSEKIGEQSEKIREQFGEQSDETAISVYVPPPAGEQEFYDTDTEIDPPDDFEEGGGGQHGGGPHIPIRKRCVLFTNARAYYVLNERNALYQGPFDASGLPAMMEKYCPNVANPLRGGKNDTLFSVPEILTRYGTEVDRVIAIIGRRGIRFDTQTRTVEEGVAAIRPDLRPKYHPVIAQWLALFGGAHIDKLLDWLATFTELDSPTCGLYLRSTGGTGKGLLASGLARLWGTSPTMYANIVGTHNDGIAHCPLIWADEEIPPSNYGKTPSAVFRTLVGNSEFNLRRMYSPAATIKGCLRLLVTANNDNALKIEEDLSPDDYQAIVQRIGYIQVPDAARQFLEKIGGRAATKPWVEGDGIAEHVLWLRDNRKVKRGNRFLVEGWESSLHKSLQSTSGITGLVVEVIGYALCQQIKAKNGGLQSSGFVMGNKHVYCTIPAIAALWDSALGDRSKTVSKQRIRASLRQLAVISDLVKVEVSTGFKVEQVSMWAIRAKEILEAVEQYQLGDVDAVAAAINRVIRVH